MMCPPDHAHADTTSCYTAHKCRCQPCRDGSSARAFERRQRRHDPCGRCGKSWDVQPVLRGLCEDCRYVMPVTERKVWSMT